ncbi:MAG: DoxX family protein [Pseudomonadota bacterium]
MTISEPMRDAGLLVGRVLLVFIYVLGAIALIKGSVPVDYAASKGFPAWLTWAGYIVKVAGGFAVLLGFMTRLGALGLIVFTLLTAFVFHPLPDTVFFKEISMIGGLILVFIVGPGRYSIDHMRTGNR